MGKKLLLLIVLLLFASSAMAINITEIDRNKITFKGGPTDAREELAIVWLETILYPNHLQGGDDINLAARLTSRVDEVYVTFDFDRSNPVRLHSVDGLVWENRYVLPKNIEKGLHAARFKIIGRRGSVDRSLDFFVDNNARNEVAATKSDDEEGWPLKIISDSVVFIDSSGNIVTGSNVKKVKKDEVVKGLYKVPWYKVRLKDGREGWLISINVEEPVEEFYQRG
ncbi:MAG: hypothetical protein ABIA63_05465, partial [bacterium]